MNIYEEPTDELRQVEVEGDAFMGQPRVLHYRIQRKWKISEGEDFIKVYTLNRKELKVTFVWRDLPIVSEIEAR